MQLMQILHKQNLKLKTYQEDMKWKGIAFASDKSSVPYVSIMKWKIDCYVHFYLI